MAPADRGDDSESGATVRLIRRGIEAPRQDTLKRQTDTGWAVSKTSRRVVTVTTQYNVRAYRRCATSDVVRHTLTIALDDLGVDANEVRAGNTYYEVAELFVPQKETRCEFVAGDTLDERVEAFAKRIVEVTSAI